MVRPSDKPYQVNIGRRGITDGLVAEIARQLEDRGEVKVKLLKVFTDPLEREEIDDAFAAIEALVEAVLERPFTRSARRGFTKTYAFDARG